MGRRRIASGLVWTRPAVATAGVVLAVLLTAAGAKANEYDDKDLSVRLASAFIRFTEVSAFGGETAANRWSPAVNPATADWQHLPRRLGIVLAPYWSHIKFDNDNIINVFGEAGVWDTRRYGTFQPALSQLRSNEKPDRQGLVFDYETNTFLLQYGRRLRNWALGVSLNINQSEVVQRLGGLTMSRSEADTYRIRVGGLHELRCDCRWLFGAVAEYGWTPFDFEALVPTPTGFVPVSGEDTQDQLILRGGVSFLYKKYSTVFADYQYGRFTNDRDTLDTHRFSAGVQHQALPFLFLRGGGTVDHYGNVGFMAGASVGFARWGSLHFGYQHDVLPELTPNFGGSHTFQLTLSIEL